VNEEIEQKYRWALSVIPSQSRESLLSHDASGIAGYTKRINAGVDREIFD
jgi:hypothetical protein